MQVNGLGAGGALAASRPVATEVGAATLSPPARIDATRGAVGVAEAAAALQRSTYDAEGSENPSGGLGKLVRKDDAAAIGDVAVDAAHDNAKIVHDFFSKVLGRDSLDDRGMELKSVVHFGKALNNAYWDGQQMTYGDGDGKVFAPLSTGLDVVAHEMAHGVTEHSANMRYQGQPGALNESWSDVFGELVEQWHENPEGFAGVEGAKKGDWLIGEDVFTPGKAGDGLRNMQTPGTAYDGDPQPGHMKDYKVMREDNGGVHVNSGIPNKAAYEAATRIGGEKVAQIWYRALTTHLRSNSTFSDAAVATVESARELFKDGAETQAIIDAWTAVGIVPGQPTSVPGEEDMGEMGEVGEDHVESHGPDDGVVPSWLRGDGKLTTGEMALA